MMVAVMCIVEVVCVFPAPTQPTDLTHSPHPPLLMSDDGSHERVCAWLLQGLAGGAQSGDDEKQETAIQRTNDANAGEEEEEWLAVDRKKSRFLVLVGFGLKVKG
jgi:hypothetical protein